MCWTKAGRGVLLVLGAGLMTGCGGEEQVAFELLEAADLVDVRAERLEFSAEDHSAGLLGTGWSDPEETADGKITFTWAVGREASLELPVLGGERSWLVFRCRPVVDERRQAVHLALNGVSIGSVGLEEDFRRYALPIPPGTLVTGGANRLDFSFAHAVRPHPEDPRRLAAAFDALAVARAEELPPLPGSLRVADGRLDQPAPSEAAFPIRVPVRGALRLGVDASRAGGPGFAARILARRTGRRDQVIFDLEEPVLRPRVRLDLGAFAGEDIDLVFQALGEADGRGAVAWERPRLLGDVGEVDLGTRVVLIVVDTLRSDFLSSYGGPASTPHIDALAASGVLFRRAWSHAPMTMPSHASMFTSLLPTEHGARVNTQKLPEEHLTLAEVLRGTYRRTAAFVSLGVLSSRFRIDQGFDEFYDRFDRQWWKTAGEMNAKVLPWVERQGDRPFFLWAHYSDPHEPYRPPGTKAPRIRLRLDARTLGELAVDATAGTLPVELRPGAQQLALEPVDSPSERLMFWEIRAPAAGVAIGCVKNCRATVRPHGGTEYRVELPALLSVENTHGKPVETRLVLRGQKRRSIEEWRRLYQREIEYVDREIGRLLETLRRQGLEDDTLVILTSDHGEGLGDHDFGGHVHQLYDTLLRVPLILSWPGRLPSGKVVEKPVSHVDLLPTVLDLLNVPDRAERTGRSLVPLIEGRGSDAPPPPIVAETFRPEALRDLKAMIARGHKLIHTIDEDRYELYELHADPGELRDLAAEEPDLVARMKAEMAARLAEAKSRQATPEQEELSREDRARLRALGYIR